jgi:hypothetical protein
VNGAVVDGEGNLLVSSAVNASPTTPLTPRMESNRAPGHSGCIPQLSIWQTAFPGNKTQNEIATITAPEEKFSKLISVYPNRLPTAAFRSSSIKYQWRLSPWSLPMYWDEV